MTISGLHSMRRFRVWVSMVRVWVSMEGGDRLGLSDGGYDALRLCPLIFKTLIR